MEYKYREYPKQDEDPLFLKYKDLTAKTAYDFSTKRSEGSELGIVLERIFTTCGHQTYLDKFFHVLAVEGKVKDDRPKHYRLGQTENDKTQVRNFRFNPETVKGLTERGFHFHSERPHKDSSFLCEKCGELSQTYLDNICWDRRTCETTQNLGKVYKTVCICETSIPFQLKSMSEKCTVI